MDQEILERVRQLLADVLDVPESEIDAATSRDDFEEWDSLQQLNLMMAIEDAFGVELAPDDVEETADVASIVALVEERRGSLPRQ